jgi:hypothetical protein
MKKLTFILIILAIFLSACNTQPENTVLISYYPPQCWETPWESQWFEDNDKTMADWYILTENQRLNIIKDYVEDELNVNVVDIDHYPLPPDMGVRCACGYPRGEHYELLIKEDDLELMQINGFGLIEE